MKAIHRNNENPPHDSLREKRMDDTVVAIIRGLDLFSAQASSANLGTAARILQQAKEDLVYWAAKMRFYESAEDKFINQHLYQNQLFVVSDLLNQLSAISSQEGRKNSMDGLTLNPATSMAATLRKPLSRKGKAMEKKHI
ncbi:MAG: hypothetical protein J0L97_05840 [Alphaproteobacteria bacterium]|nr:hypothetical protein [Alphaproteobacteria bacterium]